MQAKPMNLEHYPVLHIMYFIGVTILSILGLQVHLHSLIGETAEIVLNMALKICPFIALYVPNRRFFNEKAERTSKYFKQLFKTKK